MIASSTRFFSSESASIFFSSLFSRSSSFSRFASLRSIMPNSRFQRWNVTSEMFRSWQTSMMLLPLSASRKMRIFSSVVCRLPFIVWVPFYRPQTDAASGSILGGHLTGNGRFR